MPRSKPRAWYWDTQAWVTAPAYTCSYHFNMNWQRYGLQRPTRSTVVIATVTTVAGVAALAVAATLLFSGARTPQQEQGPPNLALSFAVLAGRTVDNTGLTVVEGDLGGARSADAINGFPPGVVTGTQHPGDARALEAKADMSTAYFAAATRTGAKPLPSDIGGMTFAPDVYRQAGDLVVTGSVTLDGRDDPNALFIFQTARTLSIGPNSVVTLVNGANVCNVFWQVGNSATLGPGTSLMGTVLAATSVTLQTDASVVGRVLARDGDVTLDSNTITEPDCGASPPSGIPTTTELLSGTAEAITPGAGTPPVGNGPGATSTHRNTTVPATTNVPPSITTDPPPITTDPPPTETTTTATTTPTATTTETTTETTTTTTTTPGPPPAEPSFRGAPPADPTSPATGPF